jgi:hypothetical protein
MFFDEFLRLPGALLTIGSVLAASLMLPVIHDRYNNPHPNGRNRYHVHRPNAPIRIDDSAFRLPG